MRLVFHCDACGFQLYFSPAAAVAALIAREDGRVLFTRRLKDPSAGLLGLPGGFVDPDETAEDALQREVREEIGVELIDVHYLRSFANRYEYAGISYDTLDLFFTARVPDPTVVRPLDAVAGIEWREPGEVAPGEIAFESMRRAVAHLSALVQPGPHP